MANYIALIGDIIESKQVNDRAKLQINMQDAFDHINSKYDAIIRSKFTLTLGDEFQALLKPSKKVFELLEDLEFLIPVSFRYGLGYGIMKTDFDTEISIGADGPALAKRLKRYITKIGLEKQRVISLLKMKYSIEHSITLSYFRIR